MSRMPFHIRRWCAILPLAALVLGTAGCARPTPPVAEAAPAAIPTVQPVQLPTVTPIPTPLPPPTATPAPTPTPAPYLEGDPAPPMPGELAMRTYSLDLYRSAGGMEADIVQALGIEAESAIVAGSQVIGRFLSGRVSISFEPPQRGPCAIRGITLSNERKIRLFYEPETDPQRVLGILAHELFHQLQRDYYGERDHRKADVILLEGMAVWGTADYFRQPDGRALYQHRVKEAEARGELLPLTTSLEADCRTTTRNNIYNQWASFVEFLVETRGREALDAVYRSSSGRPAGSSNWSAVYGQSLDELEAAWRVWLAQQP